MNYEKHYNLLMNRSKNRTLDCYTEKHHIVPRCMGGDDNATNIAVLTPEEHFLAHQLLVKMYPKNRSLIHAAMFMTTHNTDRRVNNKLFGWLRRQFSESMSGDNNPARRIEGLQARAGAKRRGQKRTQVTKDNIREALTGIEFTDTHLSNLRKSAPTRKKPLDNKKVFMYDEEGVFVNEFNSIYDCENKTGLARELVKGVANGKHQHLNRQRFFWEFKGEKIEQLEVIYKSRGVAKSKEHIDNQKKTLAKRHTCEHCGIVSSKSAINRYHNDRCPHNPNRVEAPATKIQTLTCIHCGKTGKGTVMFRFHFDRCKMKKEAV